MLRNIALKSTGGWYTQRIGKWCRDNVLRSGGYHWLLALMVATHLRACSLKQWLNSQDLFTTRNCEVLASGCVDEIIILPSFEGVLGAFSDKNRKNRETKFLSWQQTDLSDFSIGLDFFLQARKPVFGVFLKLQLSNEGLQSSPNRSSTRRLSFSKDSVCGI